MVETETKTKAQRLAILDPVPPPPNALVPVKSRGRREQVVQALGQAGDFIIRYVKARSSPLRHYYASLTGLASVFGAAMIGVRVTGSGAAGGWLGDFVMTGLDTGQMAVMGAIIVALAGMGLYAYLQTIATKSRDGDWIKDAIRDPSLPIEVRLRLTEGAIHAAQAAGGETVRNPTGGTT